MIYRYQISTFYALKMITQKPEITKSVFSMNSTGNMTELLTVNIAAQRLGASKQVIYYKINSCVLRAYQIEGMSQIFVKRKAIDKIIEEKKKCKREKLESL